MGDPLPPRVSALVAVLSQGALDSLSRATTAPTATPVTLRASVESGESVPRDLKPTLYLPGERADEMFSVLEYSFL